MSKVTHLGVYGAWGKTMPACNGKRMPYEFEATDAWGDVTCRRCRQTDEWRARWKAHFHAVIHSGLKPKVPA